MNCKNCVEPICESHLFCAHCGAKVIRHRLTLKHILKDFGENIMGWDNKYFRTIRAMLVNPKLLLEEYFGGTRKKYMHPLTFMTIGMALSLFIFTTFDDEYIRVSSSLNESLLAWQIDTIGADNLGTEYIESQRESAQESTRFTLKYQNLIIYVSLPLYALMFWIAFGYPYNYAEHLVAMAYSHGISFLGTILCFFVGLYFNPLWFYASLPLTMLIFGYVYKGIYDIGYFKLIAKLVFVMFMWLCLVIGFGMLVAIVSILKDGLPSMG